MRHGACEGATGQLSALSPEFTPEFLSVSRTEQRCTAANLSMMAAKDVTYGALKMIVASGERLAQTTCPTFLRRTICRPFSSRREGPSWSMPD
jgi:hypothetical protein